MYINKDTLRILWREFRSKQRETNIIRQNKFAVISNNNVLTNNKNRTAITFSGKGFIPSLYTNFLIISTTFILDFKIYSACI